MTFYVDDYRVPATVGRIRARWSHLAVGPEDDIGELHAFAARIGLKWSWFQEKGWPRDHYDVTESKRRLAILAGATAIGALELGRIRADAIDRRRESPGYHGEGEPAGFDPATGRPSHDDRGG